MKVFGIINLSSESFSNDYCPDMNECMKKIEDFAIKKAYGIDFGAQSTSPHKIITIDKDKEFDLLKQFLPQAIDFAKKLNLKTSIDTFHADIAEFACENGIDYINDVSCIIDEGIFGVLQRFPNVRYILMHSLSVPARKDIIIPENEDVVEAIITKLTNKINKLQRNNIDKSRIALDPGVGFGKSALQSWEILQNIEKFTALELPIYIGSSRKSFMNNFSTDNKEKDIISNVITKMLEKYITYSRLHDII